MALFDNQTLVGHFTQYMDNINGRGKPLKATAFRITTRFVNIVIDYT